METFTAKIRAARQAKHFTLQYTATKIGTYKGYLSSMEGGKVKPGSPRLVRKLAKLLGLDVTQLLVLAFIEKAPAEIREIVRVGSLRELSRLAQKAVG